MVNHNHLEVEGLLFDTRKDADQARLELKKIQYLNENMNYSNLDKAQKLYDKMIDEKQFKTPIGWMYLLNLRQLLIKGDVSEEQLRPVPMYTVFTFDAMKDAPVKQRVKPAAKKKEPYKNRFMYAVVLNVLLAICVLAMFIIALKGETPNIINYKNNIINQYSSWEQELTERENAIREKERELNIEWKN